MSQLAQLLLVMQRSNGFKVDLRPSLQHLKVHGEMQGKCGKRENK